jgi:hypothetical protein
MADNAILSAAVGVGITVAADDIAGIHYPRSKISLGADGTAVDAGAGAGVVGTDTQRVTLGSDDPAVVALQLIDNAISGAGFNVTQFAGATVPIGAGVEATAVRVTLATDSTGVVSIDDNGGAITVDGTVAATQSGTWNVGTVTTVTTCSTVTTVTTVTTVATVTTLTGSSIAHDGADSGNPHKLGARALTSVSAQTLVAANDRTDLFAGLDGVLITRDHCNLEDIVTATPVAITDGSSTSVLASPGAGLRNYITSISIANSSATFVTVDLRDGTAGAVLWTVPVPATGGVVYTFPVPLKFSAATAVAADPSASASTITVSVLGFKSKV